MSKGPQCSSQRRAGARAREDGLPKRSAWRRVARAEPSEQAIAAACVRDSRWGMVVPGALMTPRTV